MCYFPLWKQNNIKYLERILQQAPSHEYAAEPLAMWCQKKNQKKKTDKGVRQREEKQVKHGLIKRLSCRSEH